MTNMVNITNLEHSKQSLNGRTVRFVVMLTQQEQEEIQEFRYASKLDSKAEAMRALIKIGLAQTKTATE